MQRRFRPHFLTCAIGTLLCSMSGVANAQTVSSPPADTGRLADVTVTAQKIAQPASKTALSLTAVTGDNLRSSGVTTAVGLPS